MTHSVPVKDVIAWDTVNWSQCLQLWDKEISLLTHGAQCLDVGGRSGGLSLWLALKGFHVVCSDLCDPTLLAQPLHEYYRVRDRITYQRVDATDIAYSDHFDIVIFKSLLGALKLKELQQEAVSQMHKALKKGGKLLFAENLVGTRLHGFMRRSCVAWGNSWRYITIEEMREYLSAFSSVSFSTKGLCGAFGRSELQRHFLGHIDGIFDSIVPAHCKYIIMGVAVK